MSDNSNPKYTVSLPPGTLTYIGEAKDTPVTISVIDYDSDNLEEKIIEDIRECYDYQEKTSISWINVDGVHDVSIVKTIGLYFHLHPLLLEDIVDTEQRPKVDFYDQMTFVVVQMLSYDQENKSVEREQVNLILGDNFLISFQEDKEGDVFEPIRQRLRNKHNGKLRNSDAPYLFYILLDTIVDNYYLALENVSEDLEKLEEEIIKLGCPRDPTKDLYEHKQQLMQIKKAVRPLREIVAHLIREGAESFGTNEFYLRDLYDHVVQVIDNTESYIDMCNNLLDLYLSIIGNRTNDVMKVLTIFSTIFLPLTFIVGVYGMNFRYMPETESPYGYPIIWGVMIAVSLGIYLFFKKQKWL